MIVVNDDVLLTRWLWIARGRKAIAAIPGNTERNSFLPLHPGAIRYYRQIGRAGQTD